MVGSAYRLAGAAALAAIGATGIGAQGYPPSQGYQQYDGGAGAGPGYAPQGYGGDRYAPNGYPPPEDEDGEPGYGGAPGYGDGGPPPGAAGYGAPLAAYDAQAPAGYDGSQPPPPPPGYRADPAGNVAAADQRYRAYAEDWAQRYCRRAPNNAGGGAIVGGILGALTGSVLGGRGGHGAGALLGGVGGAAIGAGVGSTSRNQTSPGCPPGYVAVGGAPAFAFPGYGPQPYAYAAPAWYRPWVFYGGRWTYRPYPYHGWYARYYGRPGFYGRPYPRPYGWHY